MSYENPLNISHEIVSKYLCEGDTAIDATAGNGNDTFFMADLVGKSGKVFAFDIQKTAITNTYNKLKKHKLENRVSLINDSHQFIKRYIYSDVKVVMFNLGYLPRGNHFISTKPESTIYAIEASLDLLIKEGIIMLVIYYGSDSGFNEKNAVMKYIKSLDYKKYSVLVMDFINWINCPPIAVCIKKLNV